MTSLNLKEIFKRRNKFSAHYTLTPSKISLPADVGELRNPVKVSLEITKERGGYRVKMGVEGSVVLECGRCLTVFEKDISQVADIRIQHYPEGERVFLRPKDLDVSFYEDEQNVDIAQLVREQILLSIPVKPLCSPDCPPPVHPEGQEESPFSVLKKLLK